MDVYKILKAENYSIIIFGSGFTGEYLLEHCRRHRLCVTAFADNSIAKQGAFIDGVPVLGLAEAMPGVPMRWLFWCPQGRICGAWFAN